MLSFFLTLSLSSVWTSCVHRCRLFFPPALAFNFIAHRVQQSHRSSIFHRVIANTRSRAFRKSVCAQKKVPKNLYEYAPGGARTLDTDLNKWPIPGSRITWYTTGATGSGYTHYSTASCCYSAPEWLEPVLWPRTWLCELMWEQQQQTRQICINWFGIKPTTSSCISSWYWLSNVRCFFLPTMFRHDCRRYRFF